MVEPAMRASYIKDNIAALDLLGADVAAKIKARVPEVVERVAAAAKIEWMPLDVDIALTAAVYAEAGNDGVRTWSRRALLRSLQGPLLKPIFDGAVRLFGMTPLSLLKRTPLVWKQIYRDCGQLRVVEQDAHTVDVVVDEASAAIVEHIAYLEGIAGAFEAVLELTHASGSVVVIANPIGFRVAWSAA